ncbi:MFS transporter [Paenibacillus darwinianus]|uniref:Bcr/CflA family efflux transporter n=2 Tax=Paenibacillus darwinianus TaxID=1380763 RepID=A0A9W5S055_9BACL|nr:multidrug effflux MFS transporter [Paenibacillus darwinianus]EXX86768.1 MFS transporter [Paenibacillus darwinianus]EXX87080.1 MFS transporter [Paenibacillus darwinianus]EXX87282.1 MFS transporter [Paenibacillus darwinianus]
MEASLSTAEARRTARNRRLQLVLVLGSLTALAPLSIDMYLPALPMLAGDFQASSASAQLSLTAFFLGLACGQLIAGPVSDAVGRRKPLLIGMSVYVAVSMLGAAAPSIEVFVLLRLVQGFAGAFGIVIARAIVRDYYAGAELTRFFAMLSMVGGAAPVLAPIAGGLLLAVIAWPGIFLVLGGLGACMLLAAFYVVPESLADDNRVKGGLGKSLSVMRMLLADRAFMGYVLALGLVSAGLFAYIAGSPFVLQDIFGVSPQVFSLMFAANGVGFIVGSQLAARFALRFGEKRVLAFGLYLSAINGLILLLILIGGAGLTYVLPPLFIIVCCIGIVSTAGSSLALQNHQKSAGSAAALMGLFSMLLGAVASPLVGLGGSLTALPMGLVIAVCNIGALGCYLGLVRRRPL